MTKFLTGKFIFPFIHNIVATLSIGLLFSSSPASAQTTPIDKSDSLKEELLLQTTRTYLKLADDFFIRGKNEQAAINYAKGLRISAELSKYKNKNNEQFLSLINKNFLYRQYLLEGGYDFWGVRFNSVPLNPLLHSSRLLKFIGEQNQLVDKLKSFLSNTEENQRQVTLNELKGARDQTDLRISSLNKERLELIKYDFEAQSGNLKSRITEIIARQKELQAQSENLVNQISSINNNLNNIMLQGLCNATGLPINPANLNFSDGLKSAVTSIGGQVLNDPALQQQLAGLGEGMEKMTTLYNDAKKIIDEVNDYKGKLNDLKEAVHKPTWDNLLKIGNAVIAKLDNGKLTELREKVMGYKPVNLLLHLKDKYKQLNNSIQSILLENKNSLQAFLDNISTDAEQMKNFGKDLVEDFNNCAERELKKKIFSQLFRLNPKYCWDKFSNEIRNAIQTKLNVAGVEQFMLKVKNDWSDVAAKLDWSIENERLVLAGFEGEVKDLINDYVQKLDVYQDLGESFKAVYGSLLQQKDLFSKLSFKDFAPQVLEEQFSEMINKLGGEGLDQNMTLFYDRVVQHINSIVPDVGQALTKEIFSIETASLFVNASSAKGNIAYDGAMQRQPGNATAMMQQQLLTAGLSMACPYVAMGVQFVNGFLQKQQLKKQIDAINAEQKSLTVERLHIYDMLDRLAVRIRLAELDKAINEENRKYIEVSLDTYKNMVKTGNEKLARGNALLKEYRPLLYYLNERIKEEFYLLNKALRFRYDRDFTSFILENPDNFRLAIDEDISLFRWVENITGDYAKNDLELEALRWQQLKILLETTCDFCTQAQTPALSWGQSEPISLVQLIPGQMSALKKAIDEGKTTFTLQIPFFPGNQYVPFGTDQKQLRLLDARVLGIKDDDKPYNLINAKLIHPGVAYVFDGNGFYKEAFFPDRMEPSLGKIAGVNTEQLPSAFDETNAFSQRWKTVGTGTLNKAEGYGLFTLYKLELQLGASVKGLTDIRIRFAYSGLPVQNPLEEINKRFSYSVSLPELRKPIELQEELIGIGDGPQVEKRLNELSARPQSGIAEKEDIKLKAIKIQSTKKQN